MNFTVHLGLAKGLVAAGVLAAFAGPAEASTIVYDLTGTGLFSGTVTLGSFPDPPYLVTAADITLNDPAAGNPVFNNVQIVEYGSLYADSGYAGALILDAAGDYLEFFYLTNYSNDKANSGNMDLSVCSDVGPPVCMGDESITQIGSQAFVFLGGSLDPESATITPPAATPEPSPLLPLSTGILSVAAFLQLRRGASL